MMLSKRSLLQALYGLTAMTALGRADSGLARTPALAAVDAEAASKIGRAWLAINPSDAAGLRTAVFGASAKAPDLAARVRAEYRRGAMFKHEGWFFSETEARLCALISLAA